MFICICAKTTWTRVKVCVLYKYLSMFSCKYLFVCLFIDLSIYQSIYKSIFLSIYLSIYLSFYLSIYLSIYQFIFLSIYDHTIFICKYIIIKHIYYQAIIMQPINLFILFMYIYEYIIYLSVK